MLLVEKGDTARGVELLQKAVELAPTAADHPPQSRPGVDQGRAEGCGEEGTGRARQARRQVQSQADVEQLMKGLVNMTTVAVVGLGYVGLPLAVEFGKKYRTIGFDLSAEKVANYRRHVDPTGEVSTADLRAATLLSVGTDPAALAEADFIIVAVPTPVDDAHQPDFRPLLGASESVGAHMKRGATVVYESTVYPGATEEICIPVLEKHSGMKWLTDFNVGYSPGAHQSRRQGTHADEDHQGRVGRHAGDARPRRPDVRQRRHGRRAPRVEHQGGRSRQGDREHAARPQHRADERAGDHLRPARHRHAGGAAGGRHEVELPAVPPGPRRRALHRRRSVLPDAQGGDGRLPPGGDPGRPAHQRRHGQVRRRADRQAPGAQRLAGEGRAGQSCSASRSRRTAPICAIRASST